MHPRISISTICFLDDPVADQFEHLQALQPTRVSLVAPQLDDAGLPQVQQALAAGGYQLETLMLPFSPERPLAPDPQTWVAPRRRLDATIDIAVQLGARSIYMTTGGHGGMVWERAAATFAEAIAPCVTRAEAAGIALMIENAPPQYADLHIAHTLRDAVTLADLAGIGVCIDLFGCWTEADLKTTLARAVRGCHLVQVSDYVCGDRNLPARAVPGDGDLPLARLLDWLLDAGYDGAFELELLGPRIDREGHRQATGRAADYLGGLLLGLGA